MSIMRERADPHLTTLRTISQALRRTDPDMSLGLEKARYGLYTALEEQRGADAKEWLSAVETAALLVPKDFAAMKQLEHAVQALKTLTKTWDGR